MVPDLAHPTIIISAVSENGVIGRGDGMPWNVPEEYQHFVETVTGHVVVMGRRSFEIFGADFEAHTFVITRRAHVGGAVAVSSLSSALQQGQRLGKTIYLAGGRSIYAQGFAVADRMLLSTIRGNYDGDVRFPEFDRTAWRVNSEVDCGTYILRDLRRVVKREA